MSTPHLLEQQIRAVKDKLSENQRLLKDYEDLLSRARKEGNNSDKSIAERRIELHEKNIQDYGDELRELQRKLSSATSTATSSGDPENVAGRRRRHKTHKHRKVSKKTMKKKSRKHRK